MLLVAASVCAVLAQAPNLRTGKYEGAWILETQGEIVDTHNEPIEKLSECVTENDLKDLSKSIAKPDGPDCTVSDYKATPGKVSFRSRCKGVLGDPVVSTTTMTFAGNSFTLVEKTGEGEAEVTLKVTAKRVGACTK
jgi:hypothetical protein